MHLTTYTDYSLRVLIYLKINEGKLCHVAEVSDYFQISKNHIMKVVNNMAHLGLIDSVRGKGGGIRLNPQANDQKIGDLVRQLEPEKMLVQCVNKEGKLCEVAPICKLTAVLDGALDGFYGELNNYTLKDIVSLGK
ncbi:MAG: Rrf2 family transcriptional regulator [Chromatiales bacterium]|jgi:Rrf2 family nitric oxide-sensitive transcriptional repressor